MNDLQLVRQTAPLPDGVDVVGILTIPAAGGWWYDRPVTEGVYSIVRPSEPVDLGPVSGAGRLYFDEVDFAPVVCRTCGGECRA